MNKGWQIKKLGEVCDFQNGFAFKSKTYKENGLPILRITNIQNDIIDTNELVYFDKNDYKENLDRFRVIRDDLLIAMSGATTGKLGVNKSDTIFYLNQRVGKFIPKKQLNKNFLYYFLSTKVEESLRIAAGAAQPNLSTEQINNFEIPLPPLPEQHRIVSILDQCFSAIDKAKANAEQNLINAKELFESYLQVVFENGNWKKKKLSDVAKHSLGKMLDKNKNKGEPQEYLRNLNVRWFDFDLSNLNKMLFLESENEKYTAIKGDVLICEGGYPGRAAIWEEDYPIFFQKAIHRVRFHKQEYNRWFLYFLFILDKTGKLKNHFTGTGIQHFTGDALGRLLVPIPPLNKIEIIVRQLDALRTETQKLETIYQKKIDNFAELKKSILGKAFAGELTEKQINNRKMITFAKLK